MTTLAQFMEAALYGADGYYSAGHASTGMRGDYFTAPETGDAFGQLLRTIFNGWRERLKTDPFYVVEVGAGEGRLLKISDAAIERSSARREKMRRLNMPIPIYSDFSEMKTPMTGIIFANELIDAFPVHRVRMKKGKLEEMYVPEEWRAPSTPRLAAYFDRLRITLPEGYETEVNLHMEDWLREASAVLRRGLIALIDYGRPAWDYYAEERTGGTLRGFKDHRVLGLPELLAQGSLADWTADVDFTSLALDAKEAGFEPLAFLEMGTFLKMGLPGMGAQPCAPTSLRYLLHPEGLGAQFHVLILGKNLNPAEWTFDHNRITRLGLNT